MIKLNNIEVKPTIFPDKTSQIWCLTKEQLSSNVVEWYFENESELISILQLGFLLSENHPVITLKVPFLPYSRADKKISNDSTFGLKTFLSTIKNSGYHYIKTYDEHSRNTSTISIAPTDFINHLLSEISYDYVLFPDEGAKKRYEGFFKIPAIYATKVRDQLTGNLLSLEILGSPDLTGKTVLVYDDICDGGGTFILLAKNLKTKPKHLELAVTHGIFSKGKECLYDAGYNYIYTTNSLLKNKDEFKINF